MHFPIPAAPQHFHGELTAKTLGCCLGLHRMEVRLLDDDGGQHVAYIAYGRGELAGEYAQAEFDRLTVGAWYHASASLVRRTAGLTEWCGNVTPLHLCRRGHRFSHHSNHASATASAGAAA